VAPIRIGRSSPVDLERMRQALADIKRRFDVVAAEAGDKIPAELVAVRQQTASLLQQLRAVDRETAEPALTYLQSQLYRDFVSKFYSLQRNLNPRPISIEDVPVELRRKFVGGSGHFLLQIHPKVDIWEREGARRFVGELRSVDPEVTGAPIITYEATQLMERGYRQGTAYAFILVGALTALMIRRLKESLLALLPLVLGVVWTIGLMHLCGLKFNLANVWGLPLIVGTSAEFGLNLVLRYMEGRAHGGPLVARSTVMAVTVNGLTTLVGFASLMVAAHQGIFGLGLLLALGMVCGLAASLLVLPVTLRLIAREAAAPASDSLTRSSAA
jgi:predicted RND superfamily exporter protein